ncbi:MAG: hypothetical protein LBQ54_16495 [Planctomycetaceae bacterium]|nr:hypothetical protein [Planctomycetaceae bacterium]
MRENGKLFLKESQDIHCIGKRHSNKNFLRIMTYSTIIDNDLHGMVGDFLAKSITPESNVSIVSAYFTIYAYQELKTQLDSIEHLRFLFGEPTFVNNLDPDRVDIRDFKIEDETQSIVLANRSYAEISCP